MKTTLEIPDELVRRAKVQAAKETLPQRRGEAMDETFRKTQTISS